MDRKVCGTMLEIIMRELDESGGLQLAILNSDAGLCLRPRGWTFSVVP